jgi:hypothetical protein
MPFDREEYTPLRAQPMERLAGRPERHRNESWWHLATATIACPSCDAPVLPDHGGMTPAAAMTCGYCLHSGAVRDFLSLAEPTRPTRVSVRVRLPALR